MEVLLGNFIAQLGIQDTLKPAVRNESLHKICNDLCWQDSKPVWSRL